MAKLNQSQFTITVSELLKDTEEAKAIIDPETLAAISSVISELVGSHVLVEITEK